MNDLIQVLARALGTTPEALEAEIQRRKDESRRRIELANARYHAALRRVSDVQAVLIDQAEREGHKINKLLQDRSSGNVAVMLVKERVWDGAKGKMARKILVVYPDGTRTTTMEKTISIKRSF